MPKESAVLVVDSSVWIDFFNDAGGDPATFLKNLREDSKDNIEEWHTGCDCIAVPVFDLQNWPGRDQAARALQLWIDAGPGVNVRFARIDALGNGLGPDIAGGANAALEQPGFVIEAMGIDVAVGPLQADCLARLIHVRSKASKVEQARKAAEAERIGMAAAYDNSRRLAEYRAAGAHDVQMARAALDKAAATVEVIAVLVRRWSPLVAGAVGAAGEADGVERPQPRWSNSSTSYRRGSNSRR